jgi:hypothetical protein
MRECRSRYAESAAAIRMLSHDRIACCSLRERRAVVANSHYFNCEVRYKSVGFGQSDRLNPTDAPCGAAIATIVRRTGLESCRW